MRFLPDPNVAGVAIVAITAYELTNRLLDKKLQKKSVKRNEDSKQG